MDRRRRRDGVAGGERSGDFDRAECGIGTSIASGAAKCRTGGGTLAVATCGNTVREVLIRSLSNSVFSFSSSVGDGTGDDVERNGSG